MSKFKKVTKTEAALMKRLKSSRYPREAYFGKREAHAAKSLEERGWIKRIPAEGWHWVRRANGDYIKRYCPQGNMELVEAGDE